MVLHYAASSEIHWYSSIQSSPSPETSFWLDASLGITLSFRPVRYRSRLSGLGTVLDTGLRETAPYSSESLICRRLSFLRATPFPLRDSNQDRLDQQSTATVFLLFDLCPAESHAPSRLGKHQVPSTQYLISSYYIRYYTLLYLSNRVKAQKSQRT